MDDGDTFGDFNRKLNILKVFKNHTLDNGDTFDIFMVN